MFTVLPFGKLMVILLPALVPAGMVISTLFPSFSATVLNSVQRERGAEGVAKKESVSACWAPASSVAAGRH